MLTLGLRHSDAGCQCTFPNATCCGVSGSPKTNQGHAKHHPPCLLRGGEDRTWTRVLIVAVLPFLALAGVALMSL